MKISFEQIMSAGLTIGLLGSLTFRTAASPLSTPGYLPPATVMHAALVPPAVMHAVRLADTVPSPQVITINVERRGDSTQPANSPLYVVDGVAAQGSAFTKLNPNQIESITVLKGESAASQYGEKGKNGVILITLKKAGTFDTVPSGAAAQQGENVIFTKVEIEAEFPGGDAKWTEYVKQAITANMDELKKDNHSGTVELLFVVNLDGSVTGVQALTMQNTKLAELAVSLVNNGPKWIPAMQSGHTVKSFRKQKITFLMPTK